MNVLPSPSPHRWTFRAWGLGIVVSTLILMIATESRLSIVWDEGFTLGREARIRAWLRALRDPERFAANWQPPIPGTELVQPDGLPAPSSDQIRTRRQLFNKDVLAWFWPFAREEPHGHPPFYAIVGMVGDLLAPSWWPPLARARLGPMLLFSLTAGGLWTFAARHWGVWAASLTASAWVFQPNLFANGHYATVDITLASLWILALIAFSQAVLPRDGNKPNTPSWIWCVLFGLIAGWAADTKLTGWFLPLPFLAWAILQRDRRGLLTLLVGGVIAVSTLYLFNPGWWNDPVDGVRRFLVSNLTRSKTISIPVLFLGQIYRTPNQSLPWYNTLVWTLFVTPVGFLGLALIGLGRSSRRFRTESIGTLAVAHWGFLLALRALPHTPGHDGVRQFLPAFGFLALLAGIGTAATIDRFGRGGKILATAAMLEGVISLALIMPVPLSYFSPVVGGLPGAVKLGMEPTYFWDALTDEALRWLNEHTPPDGRVEFATYPTSWLYLHEMGRLRPSIYPDSRRPCTWFVLQNRPGAFGDRDRQLIAHGRPAYVVEKSGIPLVWIYPGSELMSLGQTRRDRSAQ